MRMRFTGSEAHHQHDMKIDWLMAMLACGRGAEGSGGGVSARETSADRNRATFKDRVPCLVGSGVAAAGRI